MPVAQDPSSQPRADDGGGLEAWLELSGRYAEDAETARQEA